METARVFPRKTNMSPTDPLAFFGPPPESLPEINEVHISVVFSWDMDRGAMLAESWSSVAPVKIGGPAFGDRGSYFIPGKYLRPGCVITSRGCPNRCWFCNVWRREGNIRELPIENGWNVLDSNLLACSDSHISKVFEMLARNDYPVHLTGGLEAARLTDWHISLLWDLRPSQMFFAYDTPDDLDPLIEAGRKLRYANFTRHHLRCYVLIGWPKDSFEAAEKRLFQTWTAGFMPMAMLWRNNSGDGSQPDWKKFQRSWARPAIIKAQIRQDI